MLTRPRWLLQWEGAALFGLSALFYERGHFAWGLYALLFLVPDLCLVGYLANAKVGAALYNLVHTLTFPVFGVVLATAMPEPRVLPFLLIWISHIGFDRMLGFGLKYPTQFRDTHLQHV